MSWEEGFHCRKEGFLTDTNKKLAELEGELSARDAQICFAKYCYANPRFAAHLLMGIDLYPFQDVMIRAMFEKDFFLGVCGRGLGKSTIASVFIPLYAIFNPGITIGVTSATFRQSRAIFEKIESMAMSDKGKFLRQCLKGKPNHKSDAWEMVIGESKIVALPLGAGDKIRGYRFNLLVIDELLLLSEKVINEVLLPFMAIQANARERQKIREQEDELIAAGLMKAEERTTFPNNKLIGLTSASYEFEYLYRIYKDYESMIFDPNAEKVSHGIMQLSCEMAPKGLYDETNVLNAKKTFSAAQFNREYMAQFTGDSSGFYSARKMQEATIPDGSSPSVRVKGDPSKNYLLAIDPNYDSSEGSDHFAMSVFEIDTELQVGYMVHGYAVAACSISERMEYIKYLFDSFNIVYVIVDKAGGEKFIKDINELNVLPFKLEFFDAEFETFSDKEIFDAKQSYDSGKPGVKKIVHSQYFSSQWIRLANETLAGDIDNKRIWFASPADPETINIDEIPIKHLKFTETESYGNKREDLVLKKIDFIDHQTTLIKLTKNQCSLIEVSTNANGSQRFDLPANLQKQTGPTKTRKDSYSALVLGNWGLRCYFSLLKMPQKQKKSFTPVFIV